MGLQFLTAGESHGPSLVAILEGLPAGVPISVDLINADLARRQQGYGAGPRMKVEQDQVRILAGLMHQGDTDKTIGSPIAFLIENKDHSKWREHHIAPFTTPRPGHADLSGTIKYGYTDLRPALERASARETASRVAVGSACRQLLSIFDIHIGGYVSSIGGVTANFEEIPIDQRITISRANDLQCPDVQAADKMRQLIRNTMDDKDTLGGIIEIIAWNVPPGLGSYVHWSRRLDSRLGAAIISIPAIKGIEFGSAFKNTRLKGTQVQDAIYLENGKLIRRSNHCGGLEGGISNGEPIVIRAAMKPIATTLAPQRTVDLLSGEETPTQYERSDFCPVPRAVVILEAMAAFVLADALLEKLGGDNLDELLIRFRALRQARLSDLPMDGIEHVFWPDSE